MIIQKKNKSEWCRKFVFALILFVGCLSNVFASECDGKVTPDAFYFKSERLQFKPILSDAEKNVAKGIWLNTEVQNMSKDFRTDVQLNEILVNGVSSMERFKYKFYNEFENPVINFGIYLENVMIGIFQVSTSRYDEGIKSDVAYHLDPLFWKKGFAKESLKRMVLFIFDVLGSNKITAEIEKTNEGSIAVAVSNGFTKKPNPFAGFDAPTTDFYELTKPK
ncbi:MAG: GNAT family N-acetyltransferase [Bacteriovoracaceae bacterium]|nr:GNAT family N-acetyltransferase [Bacteriovoracaceae bacterium]